MKELKDKIELNRIARVDELTNELKTWFQKRFEDNRRDYSKMDEYDKGYMAARKLHVYSILTELSAINKDL